MCILTIQNSCLWGSRIWPQNPAQTRTSLTFLMQSLSSGCCWWAIMLSTFVTWVLLMDHHAQYWPSLCSHCHLGVGDGPSCSVLLSPLLWLLFVKSPCFILSTLSQCSVSVSKHSPSAFSLPLKLSAKNENIPQFKSRVALLAWAARLPSLRCLQTLSPMSSRPHPLLQ